MIHSIEKSAKTARIRPELEATYTYDNGCANGIGRLCGVKNSSVNTSYDYNALGQTAKRRKY